MPCLLLLPSWLDSVGCVAPEAARPSALAAWNVFDTFIVTIGIILMTPIVPPGHPLAKLKLLRAFRVFRLFKRVKSLNKIIVALVKAIPGVSNAFVIMIIFFCIYAILAVELFRDFGIDGYYNTTGSQDDPNSVQVWRT